MKESQDIKVDQYETTLMQRFIQIIGQILQTSDEEKRRELWDQVASFYVMILEHKGSFFANMALLDWLSKEYQDQLASDVQHPKQVLDLGSGPSTLYRAYDRVKEELSKRGIILDVSEIDASPQMLAHGVAREGKQYLGSFEDIDQLPENNFDLVNLSYAYRFISRPVIFMQNVHRILKKDGLVAIVLPEKNQAPESFIKALDRLGFKVVVGQGEQLQAKLDSKTYTQLMLEYGKEFADDLAKHANGHFTLIVAQKDREVDWFKIEISDDDLKLLNELPINIEIDKLNRIKNLFKDKLEGLEHLVYEGKVEGDVLIAEKLGEPVGQSKLMASKFADRVGKHLSNLLPIIHSDVDKESMSDKQRRQNYKQVKRGLERLLVRLTEMIDAQNIDAESANHIKQKWEHFRNDKKTRQWFDKNTDLNSIIAEIESKVGADQAMAGQDVGGIDFNSDKMNLEIENSGSEIKFDLDDTMLQQLQNAPGVVPVIINIQPLNSLPLFWGIQQIQVDHEMAISEQS